MIALQSSNGYNGTTPLLQCFGQHKFQFAEFVATEFNSVSGVVAFDPQCNVVPMQ